MKRVRSSINSLAAIAASLTIGAATLPNSSWAQAQSGGELTYGIQFLISPTDMINHKASIDLIPGLNIYDALYRTNLDGSIVPWLAEETTISPDGLKWTLKLRKGVKFHDGTAFNAEAVKWNLETRRRPSFLLSSQMKSIAAINVIDEGTVELVLSEPVAALKVVLSSPAFGMQSPTAFQKYPNPADYASHAAGTGPFKLSGSPVTTSQLELVRNDEYWAGKPRLDRLAFQAMPDESSRVAALEADDIQYTPIPVSDINRLKSSNAVKLLLTDRPVGNHYVFINQREKFLADKRVRQALSYAINQDDLAKLMFGAGQPADSIVPASVVGYSAGNPYKYDPAKAKQLLAEAGVPAKTKLKLMTFPATQLLTFAQLVKQQLDAVGFDVTIDVRDLAGWNSAMANPGEWQLSMAVAPPHYPDVQAIYLLYLASSSSSNWGGYNNPEVDKLLVEQSKTMDPAARQKLFDRIQELVYSDAAIIPFSAYRISHATTSKVNDVQLQGVFAVYFDRAWLRK